MKAALDALRNSDDESNANRAYDAFLWAIGNHHAGTFYPVVLDILPETEQILTNGNPWAQRAVMKSLINLGGSFAAQGGYENHLGVSVQDAHTKSAVDLLELIDDQAT